jgi:selenide,water dikinase
VLDEGLKNIKFPISEDVLVDASNADDAGVFRIDQELALVQTIDFFTPVVDDPYLFGQIAAANALSDIYAMGAEPISALNIICFPETKLEPEVFRLIIQGGADKAKESGTVILGGHSVSDQELKYGMAVTGKIKPERIKLNRNIKSGDKLILTKPLGTGILTTALKNGLLDERQLKNVIDSMRMLNNIPVKLFDTYPVSACTDITGYGLLGHLREMMDELKISIELKIGDIPFFDQAIPFAREMSQIPGGTLANQKFNSDCVDMGDVDTWYQNLLYDPQTSGGLLISIPQAYAADFIEDLKHYPLPLAVIGDVFAGKGMIYVKK